MKYSTWWWRIVNWFGAFIDIIDAIFVILTFASWYPNFSIKWLSFWSKKACKMRIAEQDFK